MTDACDHTPTGWKDSRRDRANRVCRCRRFEYVVDVAAGVIRAVRDTHGQSRALVTVRDDWAIADARP